jgi:hypothetical protein
MPPLSSPRAIVSVCLCPSHRNNCLSSLPDPRLASPSPPRAGPGDCLYCFTFATRHIGWAEHKSGTSYYTGYIARTHCYVLRRSIAGIVRSFALGPTAILAGSGATAGSDCRCRCRCKSGNPPGCGSSIRCRSGRSSKSQTLRITLSQPPLA